MKQQPRKLVCTLWLVLTFADARRLLDTFFCQPCSTKTDQSTTCECFSSLDLVICKSLALDSHTIRHKYMLLIVSLCNTPNFSLNLKRYLKSTLLLTLVADKWQLTDDELLMAPTPVRARQLSKPRTKTRSSISIAPVQSSQSPAVPSAPPTFAVDSDSDVGMKDDDGEYTGERPLTRLRRGKQVC